MMIPALKNLYQEEGEIGRQKFSQYTRMLTLPIAVVQGISFLLILERQGVIVSLTPFQFAANLLVITAGSILLMWIGELISEFGLGNGVSLIIFAGIVSRLPQSISQALFSFDATQIPVYLGFLACAVALLLRWLSSARLSAPCR
jgi:preprotein translocase subunit SecY